MIKLDDLILEGKDPGRDLLVRIAWQRGILSYKLYDYQQELYNTLWEAIGNPKCLKYTLIASRRWGKSTVLCLIAIEFALRNPGSQIRFAAPTAKALKKITQPIFKMLIQDAPGRYRPYYKNLDQVWIFNNGSEIHCAGTDNGNYESLRGTTSHLNIIDEAGFADELDYIVRSVLMPQTLTTGGTTLLASTPSKTPAHDLFQITRECEADGFYRMFTIYDNPTLTKDIIDLYAKEAGGYESTTFKREYLCIWVTDLSIAIVPEWKDDYIGIVEPQDVTKFYHRYVGMDLGVKDFTAVIFGYYDFMKATLVIEDELTMNGPDMTTDKLKDAIIAKEKEVFKDIKPYRRISDNNNLMLLQDLGSIHNLHFIPTNKDSLEAMINELRLLVAAGRIRIHPRCKQLIGCIKYGIWNDKHTEFSRKGSAMYGHFDHLAALIYMVRNLDQQSNPVPATYNISLNTHYIPKGLDEHKSTEQIKKMFGSAFKNPK